MFSQMLFLLVKNRNWTVFPVKFSEQFLLRIDLLLIQITVRDRVTSWGKKKKYIRGPRDVKYPISTNRSPGERLEEHKQWCDYLTIRPVALSGYGSIAHEAKPNELLTRGP